jgi:MFS family permease
LGFHGSAAELGLLYSTGAVGAIAASLLLSQLALPRRHIVVMYLLWSTAAFTTAGYALVAHLWQAMLIAFVLGVGFTGGNIIWGTLVGLLVPREPLGRVTSVDWLLSIGLIPAAYATVGPLADAIGVEATFAGAGIVGGLMPLLALLVLPAIRETERGQLARPRSVAIDEPAHAARPS